MTKTGSKEGVTQAKWARTSETKSMRPEVSKTQTTKIMPRIRMLGSLKASLDRSKADSRTLERKLRMPMTMARTTSGSSQLSASDASSFSSHCASSQSLSCFPKRQPLCSTSDWSSSLSHSRSRVDSRSSSSISSSADRDQETLSRSASSSVSFCAHTLPYSRTVSWALSSSWSLSLPLWFTS